jgi:predicted nucleotidyltransferase
MNLSRPLTSLISNLEGEALTVLAGADSEFTGLQVHQILGRFSDNGVREALNALAERGIVLKKPAGAANLYRLNPDHILTPAIREIATSRGIFLKKLTQVITGWEVQPICAAVFGPASRGDMTSQSDIDLFIHRKITVGIDDTTWRRQLTDLSLKVDAWTGNYLQLFELNDKDIAKERTSKDGVLKSIIRDGILVFGKSGALLNLKG